MEALSLAANIISVVHVTSEVIDRLNDFRSSVDGIPRTLQALSNELPTLRLVLKKISEAINDGHVPEDSQEALRPLITDFEEHVEAIKDIVEKMRPKEEGRMARNIMAVKSFRYDGQIKEHEKVIRGYASTLSLERVVSGPGKDLAALQLPLVPTFVCPYGQDPDFVERPLLADLLAQRRPGSRHALVGGAGMGKSQLAISYGYNIQEAFPDTWIFWLDAESIAKIEQGYREIANTIRLQGRHDKNADILNLVYEWLRNKSNGKWVMILDNADDKDVFTSYPSAHHQAGSGKQIRDFLPQSSNGSILVTSRSRDAAFQVTCNYKHILTVEPMTESEAMALLRSQLEETHPEQEMKLLSETLGFVPLAISQAAANISRRSLPISNYLEELRKGNESCASLLDESSPQLRRDSGRSNSIVATWKVTFEYVSRTAPSAARLLSLMCFFDRQDIPGALLERQYGEEVNIAPQKRHKVWWRRRLRTKRIKEESLPSKSLPCDFEEDWLTLRDFSLIKLNRNRTNFSMHPMVQFTTLKWLVLHKELDAWSQHFTSIMNDTFPDPTFTASKMCEPLIAHALAAIPYRPVDKATQHLQIWAALTSKVACYYYQCVHYESAQKLYRAAAQAFGIAVGNSAPQTLEYHVKRGTILIHLKRYTEAETVQRRVLDLRSKSLGLEHDNTLESMDHVGDVLAQQGCDVEAEKFYTQALRTRIRTLGPTHVVTQHSFGTLAMFFSSRDRAKECYGAWRQAYEARSYGRETVFDAVWAHELTTMGLKFLIGGDLSEAERCFREAVTEHEKKPPDGALVQCLGCLARTLAGKGDCSGAEPFFKRTIEWYEACGASKDDERFSAMSDLAYCLLNMNRLDDAEVVASRCLVERAKKCGLGDSKVFGIMWILASIMEKQGRYEKALELFKQASEGMKETLGEQHEDTKTFQGDYIRLLEEKGNSASGNVARTHRKPDKICSIAKEDATAALKIDRVCDELVVCGNQDTVAGAEQDEKSFRLISVP